jgi:peptidoglycan/LPS O-acetylase OafA/YrhL
MGRIKELDGLRAIAVLAVLAVHFAPPSIRLGTPLDLAWSGVDLFFAISGFLITDILIGLRGKEAPFRTFYWRRTLRIFPPYYLALALVLVLALVYAERVDYREILRHALFVSSATPGLVKFAVRKLLLQTPPTLVPQLTHYVYSPLQFKDCFGIYWSLSVEELFYLVWAPIVLKGTRRMVLFFSVAPLLVCPILRGLAHTTPHIGESFGFVFRFDSLAAGGCVALLLRGLDLGPLTRKVLDRGLISVIVVSSLGLAFLTTVCGAWRGVDVRTTFTFSVFGYSLLAMMCASIVGACELWRGELGSLSKLLRSQTAVYVGTVSYTMYLIHLPTYVVVQLVMVRLFGPDTIASSRVSAVVCGVLATTCTVALAGLSWKYIETPILRMKETRFPVAAANRSRLPIMETAVT